MKAPNNKDFARLLETKFPHRPTLKQTAVLQRIASFLFEKEGDQVFMLKGYAGTGKTTLIGTLVKNLWQVKMKAVLMAPTGRAAKVMGNYSQTQAIPSTGRFTFPKKRELPMYSSY